MKAEIISICNTNQLIHQDLIILNESICKTWVATKMYRIYQLIKLQKSIGITTTQQFNEKKQAIETVFMQLKRLLENSFY